MDSEQIQQLAKEAGIELRTITEFGKESTLTHGPIHLPQFVAFANIVRSATLEEAALECKKYGEILRMDNGVPNALAYQIRSLKS